MKITKITGSFNEYRLELSWGELQAVYAAMEADHANPIADEVYTGLEWYMSGRLPFPGEDESEVEKADAASKEADKILPEPPGGEGGGEGGGAGPSELGGDEPAPDGDLASSAGADEPAGDDVADRVLPEPPKD